MKRSLLTPILLLLVCFSTMAQIHVYPLATGALCEKNPAAASVLESKLKSIISRAGMISSTSESRFVLAAKVEVLQQEITPTAPPQVFLNLMVTFGVGDGYSGKCFSSTSVEVKGGGTSEERALLNAIKAIKPNSPDIAALCQGAESRIKDYYNQNGPAIINKAKGLISAHKWDEACAELYAIPSECSCYAQACDLMNEAVRSYTNYNSAQAVSMAESMWASNPTSDNAGAVMEILNSVATDSPAYAKAQALRAKVEKRFAKEEVYEHQLEAQERQDRIAAEKREYNLEKQRIAENGKTRRAVANAAAQVASAYYKSHRVTYHVHSWW